ncbi:MAG TPA: hypothetical protein VE093_04415 [Polyangiaceae bacterium]|jgi:hypothetical protein|nr:hypothetical protein [Polyangiaceae bacterium]
MRWGILAMNGIVLVGITWMVGMGIGTKPTKILPHLKATADLQLVDIAALETNASLSPTSENVAALATAYLDRDQPGLASAVLEKAPAEVRRSPEIAHLQARALFQRGRPREALATAKEVQEICSSPAPNAPRCSSWVAAKTARQVAFFREVVSAGIDDPRADPAATRAAYDRSAREVRTVAMK